MVTEAGFGADLGAEKFLDIKCRTAGIWPSAVVVVATLRALKYHGGVDVKDVNSADVGAVLEGMSNLELHCRNLREIYGLTPVVCFNRFPTDTDEEMAAAISHLDGLGVAAVESTHWADGGKGALALAEAVVEAASGAPEDPAASARYSYELGAHLEDKIRTIAQQIYQAKDVDLPAKVKRKLRQFTDEGYGDAPVCIAKTQYSLSTDASLRGAPTDHIIEIKDVRLSAGAGFIVVIAGDIMTMPGLPREPSALKIDVTEDGNITGLF